MKNKQQESAPRAAYVYVVRGAGLVTGLDTGLEVGYYGKSSFTLPGRSRSILEEISRMPLSAAEKENILVGNFAEIMAG